MGEGRLGAMNEIEQYESLLDTISMDLIYCAGRICDTDSALFEHCEIAIKAFESIKESHIAALRDLEWYKEQHGHLRSAAASLLGCSPSGYIANPDLELTKVKNEV